MAAVTSPVALLACILWALVVGSSVSLQLCVNVILNSRSPDPGLHGFFIAAINIAMGGLILAPRAMSSSKPCQMPAKWYHVLGGMLALPAFLGIPAGRALGLSVVLMVQLVAMLSTALAFDLRSGEMSPRDYGRWLGFFTVVMGATGEKLLNLIWGGGSAAGMEVNAETLFFVLATFASGVGYALQAKLNAKLILSVGSVARSTCIGAVVYNLAALPFEVYLSRSLGVSLTALPSDWPLWLYGGLQSALYIGSLSMLPAKLGYTMSYLALLVGKLGGSTIIDASGITGNQVPLNFARGLSLTFVFIGAALFSYKPAKPASPTTSMSFVVEQSFICEPDETPYGQEASARSVELPKSTSSHKVEREVLWPNIDGNSRSRQGSPHSCLTQQLQHDAVA